MTGGALVLAVSCGNAESSSRTRSAQGEDAGGSTSPEQQVLASIPPIGRGTIRVAMQTVATGFTSPLFGVTAPGVPGALFVVDQTGKISRVDLTSGAASVYLDATSLLIPLAQGYDERGLLGLAFHPDFAQNGVFYTYESERASDIADFTYPRAGASQCPAPPASLDPDHQNVIREWRVANPGDPTSAPLAASRVVLRMDWPGTNHNSGMLAFGPDRLLYVSVGDGGGEDDQTCQTFFDGKPAFGHAPNGNGQDITSVYGKVLRIDPTARTSPNGAYGIPSDNPLVIGPEGAVREIYAWGLRNFWRFSFDATTGALIGNDVGSNAIEEVDVIRKGQNYGWAVKEGPALFNRAGFALVNGQPDGFASSLSPNAPAGLIDPIASYGHTSGGVPQGRATIGGFVYRGRAIPALVGKYVFGDYGVGAAPNGRGSLLALDTLTDDVLRGTAAGAITPPFGSLPIDSLTDAQIDLFTLGFATGDDGEMYVLGNHTGTPTGQTGEVRRLVPAP